MNETTPASALFGVINNESTPDNKKAVALELLRRVDLDSLKPKFKAKLVHLLSNTTPATEQETPADEQENSDA